METKMKGLLKGLRYISQIFEGEDKEPEMQIGLPTDVKHVAHIGWDGPSTTAPSWMNEYRSAPLQSTSGGGGEAVNLSSSSAEFQRPTGDSTSGAGAPRPRTSSRRSKDSSSNLDSPGRDPTKPSSRRRPSTGAVSVDAESSEGSRRARRNHSSSEGSGSAGLESPPSSQHADLPAVPKQPRRRKTKESSTSSSSSGGSSRSRNRASDTTHGNDRSPPELRPLPSMPEREEEDGGF